MLKMKTTKRYDKYKDSGIEWIGEIPESWSIGNLKRLTSLIKNGTSETQLEEPTEYMVTRIETISDGKINYNKVGYVNYFTNIENYKLLKNDILFSNINSLEMIGNIALYKGEKILYNGMNLLRISAKKTVNPIWLFYFFKSFYFSERVKSLAKHAINQVSISVGRLSQIPIIVPLKNEQEAIAGYLDRKCGAIDETIEKQKSVIEKLKEYKQSIITQAVTKGLDKSAPMKDSGIEWIGQIPQHWDSIKLKFCSYIRARLGWKGLKAEEYVEEGYPLLSAFNIVNSKLIFENLNFINQFRYDESPEIKLQTNDILLVKDGAGIGKCAIVENMPIPSTANGSLAVISTNYRLVAKFLYYYFISTIFQAYIDRLKDGMGVPHLFQADLKEIQIVLPKEQEQKNIVEFLDKKCSEIDKNIEDKEKLIEKFTEYKKSLIYECVTGKRKVVA